MKSRCKLSVISTSYFIIDGFLLWFVYNYIVDYTHCEPVSVPLRVDPLSHQSVKNIQSRPDSVGRVDWPCVCVCFCLGVCDYQRVSAEPSGRCLEFPLKTDQRANNNYVSRRQGASCTGAGVGVPVCFTVWVCLGGCICLSVTVCLSAGACQVLGCVSGIPCWVRQGQSEAQ